MTATRPTRRSYMILLYQFFFLVCFNRYLVFIGGRKEECIVPRRQAGLHHFIILYSLWEGSRRQVIDALKASNLEADIQIDVPRLVSFYDTS
jgi:hypothetical protein